MGKVIPQITLQSTRGTWGAAGAGASEAGAADAGALGAGALDEDAAVEAEAGLDAQCWLFMCMLLSSMLSLDFSSAFTLWPGKALAAPEFVSPEPFIEWQPARERVASKAAKNSFMSGSSEDGIEKHVCEASSCESAVYVLAAACDASDAWRCRPRAWIPPSRRRLARSPVTRNTSISRRTARRGTLSASESQPVAGNRQPLPRASFERLRRATGSLLRPPCRHTQRSCTSCSRRTRCRRPALPG